MRNYDAVVEVLLEDETHVLARSINSPKKSPRLYIKRIGVKGIYIMYLQKRIYEEEWEYAETTE